MFCGSISFWTTNSTGPFQRNTKVTLFSNRDTKTVNAVNTLSLIFPDTVLYLGQMASCRKYALPNIYAFGMSVFKTFIFDMLVIQNLIG